MLFLNIIFLIINKVIAIIAEIEIIITPAIRLKIVKTPPEIIPIRHKIIKP